MKNRTAKIPETEWRELPFYALAFAVTLFMLNQISSYNDGRLADLVPVANSAEFTDACSYDAVDSVYSFAPADTETSPRAVMSSRAQICYPLKGEVTSVFAQRSDPFGGDEVEFHTGYDIAAAYGSAIYAYADGVVKQTSYDDRSGYYVVISHNEQLETFYAHCSELEVGTGDEVNAGDVIAKAGSTGRSTGSHLHFEVRINGATVNPQLYLELAAESSISDLCVSD